MERPPARSAADTEVTDMLQPPEPQQRTARAAGRCTARASRGFTLIELMIAVAIVGIIAAVAYPTYRDSVTRSRLTDATGLLSTTRVRLEQYYQDNRNYGSTSSACGVAMPTSNYFTFSCTWGSSSSSQTFLLTADGKSSAGLSGYTFTVDHANAQSTTAFVGASGLPASCWLQRPGQTC